MNQDKKYKIAIILVVILVVVCAIQGVVIYSKSQGDRVPYSFDKFSSFSSSLLERFKKEQKGHGDIFDRFFDDDFFSGREDPFKEMERLQEKLENMMGKQQKSTFRDSWDSWFSDRFLGSPDGIEFHQEEKKDSYIITLEIPNLKENKIDIEINEKGIFISGEFSQIVERKDSRGNILAKSEKYRSISKSFSLPHDVDHSKATVENKKDEIIITLPKTHV